MKGKVCSILDVAVFWLAMVALIVFIATGCARAKADDPEQPATPTDEAAMAYRSASERLVSVFFDGSRVVSRDGADAKHQGDGLIWTGIALAHLPCDLGDRLEAALAAEILAQGGALSRHPDLADRVSMDGAVGAYRGIVERIVRCSKAEVWREAVAAHIALVESLGGRLNPAADARLEYGFEALPYLVGSLLGLSETPSTSALERSIVLWATANEKAYKLWKAGLYPDEPPACYRMNLGYQTLRTIERAGKTVSQKTRDGFCAATAHADLPTVDHWCGRTHLLNWTRTFQFNVYEYRHQRCPEWESPDAGSYQTPGLDYVEGMREAYQHQEGTKAWARALKNRWTSWSQSKPVATP